MSSSRRGDVLRTFDRLGIAPDDHQLRDRLARLLGMEWLPARVRGGAVLDGFGDTAHASTHFGPSAVETAAVQSSAAPSG